MPLLSTREAKKGNMGACERIRGRGRGGGSKVRRPPGGSALPPPSLKRRTNRTQGRGTRPEGKPPAICEVGEGRGDLQLIADPAPTPLPFRIEPNGLCRCTRQGPGPRGTGGLIGKRLRRRESDMLAKWGGVSSSSRLVLVPPFRPIPLFHRLKVRINEASDCARPKSPRRSTSLFQPDMGKKGPPSRSASFVPFPLPSHQAVKGSPCHLPSCPFDSAPFLFPPPACRVVVEGAAPELDFDEGAPICITQSRCGVQSRTKSGGHPSPWSPRTRVYL